MPIELKRRFTKDGEETDVAIIDTPSGRKYMFAEVQECCTDPHLVLVSRQVFLTMFEPTDAEPGPPPHPIVRQIAGRCHVSWSDRRCVRELVGALRHGYKSWRAMGRGTRRNLMRDIIRAHAEDRELYRAVQTGR